MHKQDIQRYLNMQADRIEAVLRENGLTAWVSSGVVGPRLTVFHLQETLPPQRNILRSLLGG